VKALGSQISYSKKIDIELVDKSNWVTSTGR
jgi:hypothetical protein